MTVIEEGLPENVECGIVEILGCKTGWINDGEAWVVAVNDMLFNQFYACPSGLPTEAAGEWLSFAIRRSVLRFERR